MTAAHIPLTGLADSYSVPGTFVEIRFGVGPSGGANQDRVALIIGNKTTAGTATVDTAVYGPTSQPPMRTESDVITLFGAGSEAHRMYRRFVTVNKSTPVYIIAPTESVGTAASIVVTLTVTATASGTIRWQIEDEIIDVSISSGDTPTNVAANSVTAINNNTNWAATAGNSSGVVTITAKQKGPRGNELRARAFIVSGTPGTVSDTTSFTAFTSGATADDWTTALATILPTRYYYIICPGNDVSNHCFDDLVTQVLGQALPLGGIRQVIFAGHTGTQSAASTIAANSSINNARTRLIWQESSDWTSGELASAFCCAKALFDIRDPSYNFDDFGATPDTQQFWKVPAQTLQNKWPTYGASGNVNLAINNGLTAVAVVGNGSGSKIVMDVTTKHKNGSNFDYRNRDGHITTVCDFFADEGEFVITTRFRGGKKLASDPPAGTTLEDASIVTPRIIKAGLSRIVDDFNSAGRLKNVDTIKSGMDVIIDASVQTRSSSIVPLQVINLHHQATLLVNDESSSTF